MEKICRGFSPAWMANRSNDLHNQGKALTNKLGKWSTRVRDIWNRLVGEGENEHGGILDSIDFNFDSHCA